MSVERSSATAMTFAAFGSVVLLPALMIAPVLLVFVFPIGLLWLLAVVIPGLVVTLGHYRYVLGYPVTGGRQRLWRRSALLPAFYAAACLYTSVLGGPAALAVVSVPLFGLCLLALRARERDAGLFAR